MTGQVLKLAEPCHRAGQRRACGAVAMAEGEEALRKALGWHAAFFLKERKKKLSLT